MFDANEHERKEALREWAEYVDSHEERLALAKERLGDRYVFAPAKRQKRGQYHPITGAPLRTPGAT